MGRALGYVPRDAHAEGGVYLNNCMHALRVHRIYPIIYDTLLRRYYATFGKIDTGRETKRRRTIERTVACDERHLKLIPCDAASGGGR